MKSLCTAIGLAALLAAAPASAQRSGTYAVQGQGADGARYEGSVQLQATGPQTWRMTWRIGGDVTTGTALTIGNMLVVGYVLNRELGVGAYELQPDGSLLGVWTQGREGGVGQERLLPR